LEGIISYRLLIGVTSVLFLHESLTRKPTVLTVNVLLIGLNISALKCCIECLARGCGPDVRRLE